MQQSFSFSFSSKITNIFKVLISESIGVNVYSSITHNDSMYKSSLFTEASFADEIQIMKILFAAFSLDTVIANTSVMSPPPSSRLSRMDFHSHHKTFSHASGCEVKTGWALWLNCSDTTLGFKKWTKVCYSTATSIPSWQCDANSHNWGFPNNMHKLPVR